MKQIRTATDIKGLGTIMGVWAHPDDESYLAGGIMATAVKNGQTVVCVTATKGEVGIQDPKRWPPEQLGDIREHEMQAAMNALGVSHHHWLGYHDGECVHVRQSEATRCLQKLLKQYKPHTILTFGPDGWTGHPDHQAVSGWVQASLPGNDEQPFVYHVVNNRKHFNTYLKPADEVLNIFYNISKPPLRPIDDCNIYYKLPIDIARQKLQALRAMESQTEELFKAFDEDVLQQSWGIEAFIKAQNT